MIAQFIDGPLWYFSSIVFVLGVLYRIFLIVKAGVKPDLSVPRQSGTFGAVRTMFSRFVPRRDIAKRGRLQLVAGYMFHLGLFVLLFFAKPHVDFFAERVTGVGWTPVPYWVFIVSAELAFAGLMLLWLYRLMHPVTRLLSSTGDHVGTGLVFLVMLSGCLALAHSFEALRLTHLLLAEMLLIYFPFSNLMHAFTFIFSRGFTGALMARKGINA